MRNQVIKEQMNKIHIDLTFPTYTYMFTKFILDIKCTNISSSLL